MRRAVSIVAVAVAVTVVGGGCSDRPLYWPGLDQNNGSSPTGGSGNGNGDGGGTGNGSDGGSTTGGGGGGGPGGTVTSPARLIAPLSTARVASRRPHLRWDAKGTSGAASVELCLDRACTKPAGVAATVDGSGAAAVPDGDLVPGVVFWRVHTGAQVSATWELFVGHEAAPHDASFGAVLDLDGDGVPDLAAATSSGVAVWSGGAGGLSRAPLLLASPDGDKARFGTALAAAGDVNGDGYGDLAVGECGQQPGRVHVYFGGPGGLDPARAQALDSPDAKGGFGCRLTAAGDLDADGYGDLVVARIGQDFSGGLYLYRGGAAGLPASTTRIDSPDRNPSRIGHSLAGPGDLDGDGYDDLVVSEIEYTDLSGQVHVYLGGPDGISNARVVSLPSPDANGLQYGSSVAGAGDVNGDGYPDFVVASAATPSTTQPPRAHLYLGGPGAPHASSVELRSNGDLGFASEVEGGQDLDGDGFDDVVVASPMSLDLFHGGPKIAPSGVSVSAAGQGTGAHHLQLAGDLDGDGFADTLVGDGAGLELLRGGSGGLDRARVLPVLPPAGAMLLGPVAIDLRSAPLPAGRLG